MNLDVFWNISSFLDSASYLSLRLTCKELYDYLPSKNTLPIDIIFQNYKQLKTLLTFKDFGVALESPDNYFFKYLVSINRSDYDYSYFIRTKIVPSGNNYRFEYLMTYHRPDRIYLNECSFMASINNFGTVEMYQYMIEVVGVDIDDDYFEGRINKTENQKKIIAYQESKKREFFEKIRKGKWIKGERFFFCIYGLCPPFQESERVKLFQMILRYRDDTKFFDTLKEMIYLRCVSFSNYDDIVKLSYERISKLMKINLLDSFFKNTYYLDRDLIVKSAFKIGNYNLILKLTAN